MSRTEIHDDGFMRTIYLLPDEAPPKLNEKAGQKKAKTPAAPAPAPAPSRPATFGDSELGQRLRQALALPEANGKTLAAARLVLIGGATADAVKTIVGPMPEGAQMNIKPGANCDPQALRALAILESPEAATRPKQAASAALNTALDLVKARELLAMMPEEPKVEIQRIPSIAERAAQEKEFGASFEPMESRRGRADPWAAVFDRLNAAKTGVPPKAAPPQSPPPEWLKDAMTTQSGRTETTKER